MNYEWTLQYDPQLKVYVDNDGYPVSQLNYPSINKPLPESEVEVSGDLQIAGDRITTKHTSDLTIQGRQNLILDAPPLGAIQTTNDVLLNDHKLYLSTARGTTDPVLGYESGTQKAFLKAASGGVISSSTNEAIEWETSGNTILKKNVDINGAAKCNAGLTVLGGITVASGSVTLGVPFTSNNTCTFNNNVTVANTASSTINGALTASGTTTMSGNATMSGATTQISSATTTLSGSNTTISGSNTRLTGSLTTIAGTSYSNTSLFRIMIGANNGQMINSGVATDVQFDNFLASSNSNISCTNNNSVFTNVTGRTIVVHVTAFAAPNASLAAGTQYDGAIKHWNSSGSIVSRSGRINGYLSSATVSMSWSVSTTLRLEPSEYITFTIYASTGNGGAFYLTTGTPGDTGRYIIIQQIG